MNQHPIEQARDADLRGLKAALGRAAERARVLAEQTGTALIVDRGFGVERIEPVPRSVAPGPHGFTEGVTL